MDELLTSDKIYISESKMIKAGRGVFARVDIKKNEIIERCPIIEVSKYDTLNLSETILATYLFFFGKNKEKSGVALGFGSIYNHSYSPNAFYKIKDKKGLIDFISLKSIKKDEEISINYNHGKPNDKNPLWFNVG